ncbi:MAG: Trk system potassium transporter TrkA [Synergistaceae bacterium]|jgi:trk system potassium uptake protein TrkA|nr:Trk system potassium transporter TrkA [Synergistaceae bacterium]
MRIVIVGAGEVGFALAATLSKEGHDVNVVEHREDRIQRVEKLNVRVIQGNGARPQVLYEAGVRKGCEVDFLVACTDRDEANILSCWIARHAGVKHVIARARGLEFTDSPTWGQDLGIDIMVSPERSVAREILELLSVSSAVHTAELLGGAAGIYAFRVAAGSPLIGLSLQEFRTQNRDLIAIVVCIGRDGADDIVPDGNTKMLENDLCYVVSYREQVWRLEKLFQLHSSRPLKRVFIVGGGKLGTQVAQQLESHYRGIKICLFDRDPDKCDRLSTELGSTRVLCGEGMDKTLLEEEGIEEADGYVCATESDEVNLICCAIAKSLGAHRCIAVVRRRLYREMSDRMPADAVVDLNGALASVILRYIRYPGYSKALAVIEKVDAEMLEVVMPEGHAMLGMPLSELGLPGGVLVALVGRRAGRKKEVFVPDGTTRLQAGDQVILFAASSRMHEAAERFGGL